jgi:Methyltransferase domain
MLLCPISRRDLLKFLPKGGEVAEIGVAKGDFSQDILAAAAPQCLHLIDPWEHQDSAGYAKDTNNVSDAEQESRFESVLKRFGKEIKGGTVRLHRDYSEDAAVFFADGQLGWVYVDGMHTAEAVSRDLAIYRHKVKSDGFIVGHDYTNHVQAREWNFGVVEAVNRCVIEAGYEFVALTMERFATYVIAKNPAAPAAQKLKDDLITKTPFVVEIRDFPHQRRFEHKSVRRGDKILVYPSF